jgi:hypothetical protein
MTGDNSLREDGPLAYKNNVVPHAKHLELQLSHPVSPEYQNILLSFLEKESFFMKREIRPPKSSRFD